MAYDDYDDYEGSEEWPPPREKRNLLPEPPDGYEWKIERANWLHYDLRGVGIKDRLLTVALVPQGSHGIWMSTPKALAKPDPDAIRKAAVKALKRHIRQQADSARRARIDAETGAKAKLELKRKLREERDAEREAEVGPRLDRWTGTYGRGGR